MRAQMVGQSQVLLAAQDVYDHQFRDNCGRCHAEVNSPDFKVYLPTKDALAQNLDLALMMMESDDLTMVMPPLNVLLKDRPDGDPVKELHALLVAWKAAGAADFFPDPRATDVGAGMLASDPELGKSFTNLGSCVPRADIIGSEGSAMDELDAKFAAMNANADLPTSLADTDLFTLESEALARHGVISYAPAYTLWADDAKKMRYIRVPHGQSVVFSPADQTLSLPDNTRFYKTFLKEVKDAGGNVGFKKIETRLIVVRKAVSDSGVTQIKALYATYAWDEAETQATRQTEPLLNGTGFKDDVTWYLTDEQAAQAFMDDPGPDGLAAFVSVPADADQATKLQLAKPFLLQKQLARSYAIPGSERCEQCHQGGPDGRFILGFSPLQIRRRPVGEGGVIDPATPDELNQLQRFIEYGLITGLTVDQIDDKVLKLEKSQGPRDPRNDYELTAQGYMLGNCAHCHNPNGYATASAPELGDLLSFYPTADTGGIFQFPLERYSPRIQRKTFSGTLQNVVRVPYITSSVFDTYGMSQPFQYFDGTYQGSVDNAAPWRSLIFRNTNTPFSYSGDSAIYPHMPLNTPGYDPRASQIMARWMLSIPSVPKNPMIPPDLDPSEQPMVEVQPTDAQYVYAMVGVDMRLGQYANGKRASWLPDTSDIVDPDVNGTTVLVPPSIDLGIPNRPNWVVLDDTDPVGPWIPRNPAWKDALVDGTPSDDPAKAADSARLIPLLQSMHADDAVHAFATTVVPIGLWKKKDGCDFSKQKWVSDFPSSAQWLKDAADADATAPVFAQQRGEAVFGMICINCHGPNADSRGVQSDSLSLMTGGSTRVANFRSGLFGPVDKPGQNIMDVFGPVATSTSTAKDWASRYMPWMALGGTTRIIPESILNVVGNAAVAGQSVNRGGIVSANMLSVARSVCSSLLPENLTFPDFDIRYNYGTFSPSQGEKFLESANVTYLNGDADLWRDICSFQNPSPVQVFGYTGKNDNGSPGKLTLTNLYLRKAYTVGSAVMDGYGNLISAGLSDAIAAPWCVMGAQPGSPNPGETDDFIAQYNLARCPTALLQSPSMDDEAKQVWSLRGAVNAGRMVFQYLDELTNGVVQPQLTYDQCEKLSQSTP